VAASGMYQKSQRKSARHSVRAKHHIWQQKIVAGGMAARSGGESIGERRRGM